MLSTATRPSAGDIQLTDGATGPSTDRRRGHAPRRLSGPMADRKCVSNNFTRRVSDQ